MKSDANDKAMQIRRAAYDVARCMSVGADVDELAVRLASTLLLVCDMPGAAAAERDERTRDLESLAEERDAEKARATRLSVALAKCEDRRDDALREAVDADNRARRAESELEKERALVAELRVQIGGLEAVNRRCRTALEAADGWIALTPAQRNQVREALADRARDSKLPYPWAAALNALDIDHYVA